MEDVEKTRWHAVKYGDSRTMHDGRVLSVSKLAEGMHHFVVQDPRGNVEASGSDPAWCLADAALAAEAAWVEVRRKDAEPKERTVATHMYMQHSEGAWRVTFAARVHLDRDWAAYASASLELSAMCVGLDELQAVAACLSHGAKLPEAAARALFPNVKEAYRK